jgi:hypothetical protein
MKKNVGGRESPVEGIVIFWSDRKRYFGLPISFTKYSLSAERVFVSKGLIKTTYEQTMLYRVVDVKCSITLWQRFFGVGTVTILSNDKSGPEVVLCNIQNPLHVKEMVHHLVEAIRQQKDIKPTEFL